MRFNLFFSETDELPVKYIFGKSQRSNKRIFKRHKNLAGKWFYSHFPGRSILMNRARMPNNVDEAEEPVVNVQFYAGTSR